MIHTYEAIYESGQIRLLNDVRLPEHSRVYVVVPDQPAESYNRVGSPRLVHPQQAADFEKVVVVEESNASV